MRRIDEVTGDESMVPLDEQLAVANEFCESATASGCLAKAFYARYRKCCIYTNFEELDSAADLAGPLARDLEECLSGDAHGLDDEQLRAYHGTALQCVEMLAQHLVASGEREVSKTSALGEALALGERIAGTLPLNSPSVKEWTEFRTWARDPEGLKRAERAATRSGGGSTAQEKPPFHTAATICVSTSLIALAGFLGYTALQAWGGA